MSERDKIIAALEQLTQGQERLLDHLIRLEDGQAKMRAELMARMDRMQHRMDSLDEHLTMGLGHSDRVEVQSRAVADENRLISEQIRSLTKLLRQLEGRVNGLEERSS